LTRALEIEGRMGLRRDGLSVRANAETWVVARKRKRNVYVRLRVLMYVVF